MNFSSLSEKELVVLKSNELRDAVLPVTVIYGIYTVLGIVGNFLTMYVFFFRYNPCNFRYFVLGLALTDFVSCLTTIPGEMVSYTHWYNYQFPVICKVKDLFNQATVLSEAFFLTCIALDRYLKVCRPFGRQISQKAAVKLSLGIFITSLILAIPTPIFWGIRIQELEYRNQNITVTLCEKDSKYYDTYLPLANVITNGTIVCLADACVLIMYILVVRRMHIIQRKRNQLGVQRRETVVQFNGTGTRVLATNSDSSSNSTNQQDGDRFTHIQEGHVAVTASNSDTSAQKASNEMTSIAIKRRRTLIGLYLTAIFIVTTVLYWSLLSIVANGILDELNDHEKGAYFFFLRLYFVNHFVNPILYGLMDSQFSTEMRRLKGNLARFKC